MEFWINMHGCQPYPRHSHLYNKSAHKMIAIVSHCISFEELFDHEMTFQVVLNSRNECNTSCKEHQTTKTFKQWPQRLSDVALFISETFSHASKQ